MKKLKAFLKSTPLIYLWVYYKKLFAKPRSQSDEAEIIKRLIGKYKIPKSFIEFGFGAWEFNCANLVNEYEGLLIDGDRLNVWYAQRVLPKKIRCEHMWLDLENLGLIKEFASTRNIGILSVDVDGNDFWFLRELIGIRPALIICEYNSSFGLQPITVPYDKNFDRFKKHGSGLYFGASLSALSYLCNQNNYKLVEISESGVNGFFVRGDLLDSDTAELDLTKDFKEKKFKNGMSQLQQWDQIKELAFVDVTKLADAP